MSGAGGETLIEALAEPRAAGGWTIRSPRVGILRDLPRTGGRRGGGEMIGRITVLDRTFSLILPVGADGLVVDSRIHDRAVAVEYGQELFSLAPPTEATVLAAAAPLPGPERAGAGLPAGCHAVVSPIDGVFYRRASPGAPPYVEDGATIEPGRTLGLIEAMKSFNAVLYGGPGLPERAVIVEARAADAAEVRQGAILFVVRGV